MEAIQWMVHFQPLNPTLQKVIVEEQRLVTLPAQGDAAWKAPAENHSQKAY